MINKVMVAGADPDDDPVLRHARETAEKHLPRRIGECPTCGSVAFCAPFTMALAILDRRDVPRARRIRTVLTVAGLSPPEFPHPPESGDDGRSGNDGGWCEIVR
ncbi:MULTISPECIES: hypothetical protein [unclassified Micromonospora]|uniref:hypothetical protein n=1 Tax=unclassified Micromonospora TaxID=2617518 RepID=UPI003A8B647E